MAEIFWNTAHRVGETVHELNISWDDESFVEGNPKIEVTASSRRGENGERISASVEIGIEDGSNGPEIVIGSHGEHVRVSMLDLVDGSEILELVPGWFYGGGDPITGCLIRGGLSSVVGQIIRCNRENIDAEWYYPRLRAIGQCLVDNIAGIGWRAAYKAARCVLAGGI